MNNNIKPLVSIRCFVYNHEPYLRQCLDGFIMQNTNFAFEAIVHDDASTDNSAAIIREYAEKYPDIIKPIYEKENQYSKRDGSLRRIMNEAVHPEAKYIAFCEGDDYWTDIHKLQKQVDFLEINPEYVICSHRFIEFIHSKNVFRNYLPLNIEDNISFSFNDYISRNVWLTQPLTCMYRKSAFNIDEYLKYKDSKDLTLFYHILKSGKGYFMKDCMATYRIHNGGIWSGKNNSQQLLDDLKTLKGIYDVDSSLDAALFLKFSLIKGCYRFTPKFIFQNFIFMTRIWRIMFKYFGIETIRMILREFHIKKCLMFWKYK